MTRLQKRCLVISLTLHGLLGGILIFSAAFATRPDDQQMQILTVLPDVLGDQAGTGQAGPPASALPAPASPAPALRQQAVTTRMPAPVAPVPPPRHRRSVERIEREEPVARSEEAIVPTSEPRHHRHEIQPTFEPVNHSSRHRPSRTDEETSESVSISRAEQRRLRQIENAFSQLAGGVSRNAANDSLVDVRGIGAVSGGGGSGFASYRQAIFSIYYRAWMTPDEVSRNAAVDARVVVARDGTIISAEVINRSGESAMDNSVRRALEAVSKLPPFPESSHDEQRTFVIRFLPIANS